jgi:hypothetical protein
MQAEHAGQDEAQTILFREIRQQDAMRQQLLQQQQIQQQMFTFFFSSCFGTLYRHGGLPEP